jgi:hypothetical protein
MNKELIAVAVVRRLNEVRDRVNQLDPQRFGEGGFYLSSVKEILREQSPSLKSNLSRFTESDEWSAADSDCLTALRVLSLHGQQSKPSATYPPIEQFLNELKTKIAERETVFDLLTERYAWPLNFSFGREAAVREYLLMRLMTSVRAQVETGSVAAVNADDLLLQLNLISVHACATTDLRFLDALNYYYELLPATLCPESQHAWLLVSWLAFYARALTFWS